MIWKYAGGTLRAKNNCMKSLIKNLIKTDGSHALEMTTVHTIRLRLENPLHLKRLWNILKRERFTLIAECIRDTIETIVSGEQRTPFGIP